MQANEAADREAVDGINNGYAWKDVHETWERKTRRVLSPNAFGKYILSLAEGSTRKEKHDSQVGSSRSPVPAPSEPRQPAQPSAPPAPPPLSSTLTPVHAYQSQSPLLSHLPAPHHDSLEAQRRDISRIDRTIGQLHSDVQEIRSHIDGIRKDIQVLRGRPTSGTNHVSDAESNTLEMLSSTVSSISAKAGEVDGLKFQIEVLKRRLRRLEEDGSVGPPTPSLNHEGSYSSTARPNHSPYTTSHPTGSIPGTGWNAVNSNAAKRKPTEEDLSGAGKRQRSGPSGTFVHEYGSSAPSTQPAPVLNTLTSSPSTYFNTIRPAARYFSTQKDDSQASWRPEAARDADSSFARKPGRPRKSSPSELGTPVWEREAMSGSEIGHDGYYRPLSGAPASTVSPPPFDRGRIVRRGSGGGLQQNSDYGRDGAKRTRQRPIRNSDGILIRKDGKPDQRSISSPMNLKKVHARKIQEAEVASSGDGSPTSPLVNADTGDDDAGSGTPDSEDKQRDHQDRHPEIMSRMFPNGVEGDTRRMNQADFHFSRSDPQEQREIDRLETASAIVKEEPRVTGSESQTPTAPASAQPVDSANNESEPSNVASGPPTRRETEQTTPITATQSEQPSVDSEPIDAALPEPVAVANEPEEVEQKHPSTESTILAESVSSAAHQASKETSYQASVESSA